MTRDPFKYFRIEGRELLDQLQDGILQLERGSNPDVLNSLLRHAHTLKGAARVVRLSAFAQLAHTLEDLLSQQPPPIAQLLGILDSMNRQLAELDSPARAPAPEERIQEIPVGAPELEPTSAATPVRASLAPSRAEFGELELLTSDVREARSACAALRGAPRALELLAEPIGELQTRLAADRRSHELLGRLASAVESCRRELDSSLETLERELEQVSHGVEALRLVPLSRLRSALERTARDAASELRKTVRFDFLSADVRLPADVLSALQDSLVQLVRNAVAHGIESPEQRLRTGKPESGVLDVSIRRDGSGVRIEIRDDGAGIDEAELRARAARQGLKSDLSLLEVLSTSGLSTASEVSALAGRGVGMDVVREALQRLRGSLSVDTCAGEWTRFTVKLPLSLAWLQVLPLYSGERTWLLPLDCVMEVLRLSANQKWVTDANGVALSRGEELVPFAFLDELFGSSLRALPRQACSAVVLQSPGGRVAVGVEQLGSIRGVVLQPVPTLAVAASTIAGVTLDANGEPQLVLSAEALSEQVRRLPARRPLADTAASRRVLVIDDSLTSRMLQQSVLQSAGYQVELAASGEEALARLPDLSVDACLLDVEMPGMNGFQVLETLRSDPRFVHLPVILITSLAGEEDRRRGQDAGAQGYIVKSEFDEHVLLELLERLVK